MKKGVPAPFLCTKRMILRELSAEDAGFVTGLRSDPDVYRFFKAPHRISLAEHMNWFSNNYLHNNNRYDWVARDKDGERIGVFTASRKEEGSSEAEISYIILPDRYGQGFAREGVSAVIEFCRKYWACDHIVAEIHCENKNSLAFIKKLGFTEEKRNGAFIIFGEKV